MKILMFSHDFPPMIGGIAELVFNLVKSLSAKGVNVDLVIPKYQRVQRKDFEEVTRAKEFKNVKFYFVKQSNIRRYRELEYFVKAALLYERVLKKNKYDIIHYHALLPESIVIKYINLRSKNKIVFSNHESCFLDFFENNKKSFLHFLIKHNHFITGCSEELIKRTIQVGYDKNKTLFIPNGVDTQQFSMKHYSKEKIMQIKKKMNILGKRIIFCPRRLEYKNGVHYAIDAMKTIVKKHDDIILLNAGSGTSSEIDFIEKRIKQNDLNKFVKLLGPVKNSKMIDLYAIADIVVMPSLKEAVSIAALEAMSMNNPIVSTNVGGLPYIVKENVTGLLVPPKDSKKLAIAINKLFDKPESMKRFGENSRKMIVNNFDWKIISEKYLNIYKSL